MYQQRRPLQGLAGGVFMLFVLLAIFSHGLFLPIICVGLGLSALLGAAGSSNNRQGVYGGFLGFVFFLGIAACAFFDWWWPGIMVTVIVVAILSSFLGTMRGSGWGRFGNAQSQPIYQPPQQPYQGAQERYQPPVNPYQGTQEGYQPSPPPYGGYQEGYQPPQPTPGSYPYPDGGKIYDAPRTGNPYDQPQSAYPPQEMPPQS